MVIQQDNNVPNTQNQQNKQVVQSQQNTTGTSDSTQDGTKGEPKDGELIEIEQLLKRVWFRKLRYYKIKWKGISKTTWKFEHELPAVVVREFYANRLPCGRLRKQVKRQIRQRT